MAKKQPKYPQVYSAGNGTYSVETITYYQGEANLYGPPAPGSIGGSSVDQVTCKHRHAHETDAEKCARRLAIREAARLNAEAAPKLAARRCAYATSEYDMKIDGKTAWVRHCTAHREMDSSLRTDRDDADQSSWVCPWHPFNPAPETTGGDPA